MQSLPLDAVLCSALIVPAVIELVKTKIPADRILCVVLLVIALVLGFSHYVGVTLSGAALQVVAIGTGIVAIATAIKVRNPITSTLMITCGALIALLSIGVVSR